MATLMSLKWKTLENHRDCGIFVMMHMEHYSGQLSSKFDCGLSKEGHSQDMQLIRLRIKYASKMLLHECNIHKDRVHTLAEQFMHNYTRELIEKQIKYAIRNRINEDNSEDKSSGDVEDNTQPIAEN